jgi:hypothetical protein
MNQFPENAEHIEIVETHVIKRLKLSNLIGNIMQAFNLEKGWIYTLKQLAINPGKMARHYTGEGRLKYTAPFKMLFFTTTLAILSLRYSGSANDFTEGFLMGTNDPEFSDLLDKASGYFNLLIWIYIPIAAFFSWVVNRKSQLNYAENLVFQTYFFVITNIVTMLLVFDRMHESILWSLVILVLIIFYNVYMYKQFFLKKWQRAIAESLALYVLSSVVYFMFLIVLIFIYVKFK